MSVYQISLVLSQRVWFKMGGKTDLDDCWILTILQAILAITPWVQIASVARVREWANDPDDGESDGGNIREIVRAVETGYPEYKGKLRKLRGVSWSAFRDEIATGRFVSVALILNKLSPALRDTASDNPTPHQVLIGMVNGQVFLFNPMQDMPERPHRIELAEVKAAILEYGNNLVFGVSFPTPREMLPTHPAYKSTLDSTVRDMINTARIEGAKSGFENAKIAAAAIANDAENRIGALRV